MVKVLKDQHDVRLQMNEFLCTKNSWKDWSREDRELDTHGHRVGRMKEIATKTHASVSDELSTQTDSFQTLNVPYIDIAPFRSLYTLWI